MNSSVATMHPSDLFCEAVNAISAQAMANVLKCGKTHIYKQASRPNQKGESRTSFIEKAERMLAAVMKKNPVLAQTIADRFCSVCGGKFVPNTPAVSDKATLAEELLDNIPAFSHYTSTMTNPNATIEEKRAAKRALFDEIEQDFDESLQ